MSNLTEYCDRVRWINDPVATQQHIAGYSINQIFFVACLVKCILHLRRLRSHAAREGNFSRQGRTRAIVAALLACLCGIAYSTVIFAYKLLLINEENGRPRKIHDYMRWSYRTLQTMTLCFFCSSFFFIYQRIHWLISAVCNLPRWLEVYSKWALISTGALVLLNGGLAIGFLVDDSGGAVRIAVEISNVVMLLLICTHFIVTIPVSVQHAREQLHFEPGAGKAVGKNNFDPVSKLLGVRQATFVLCVSMLLRSIFIVMSVAGLIKAYELPPNFCRQYCGECQPEVVLVSRIIENDPFINPLLSSVLEPITLMFAFQKLGRQNTGHMGAAHALKEAKQRAAAGIRASHDVSADLEFSDASDHELMHVGKPESTPVDDLL